MTNLYTVTFDTKKGGDQSWRIDLEAHTAKEAREMLERKWTRSAHKFHISVRRIRDDEEFLYHWFVRV